ncbi:MAG: DUF881 domain-containing protein [Thermincola sp.]|jgi:uncharacterized protein YlxW (UPF0749 family)|nr:DUF881 domain-containing protein [Thermincola sp.]MDT3702854.1 DUF881 domain-containing protein [Thermincola sp.]
MFRKKWQLTLAIALGSLGLLLSMQFRAQNALVNDLNSQNNETLATIAKNLNTKYYGLIQEVWDLRTQLKLFEQSANQNKTAQEAMSREQQKLDIAIGSIPLEGSGLVITILENDQNYFGYQDLIDIVNELWNAGAEAVSVNDIRISTTAAFLPSEEISTILLNGQKLSYPYEVKAIGEPASLEKGISIPSGIIDNLRTVYNIPLEIKQVDKLVIPAASYPEFKYAKPAADQPGK